MQVGNRMRGMTLATTCGLDLDEAGLSLWHHLRSLNLRLQAHLTQELSSTADLSLPEFEILLTLYDQPEHRQRMSMLAEAVGLSRSRLTHTVRRLETKGLVTRFTCDSDRRGVHCRLTEAGESVIIAFAAEHHREVQRLLVTEDSIADLQEISRLIPQVLS